MNSQLGLGCRVGRDLICLLELTVWTKDKSESLSPLALLSKFKALSVTGSVKTTEINNTLKNLFFSIETHPMWRLSWRTSSKIKTIPGQNAFHLQTLTLHGSQCCLPAQSSQNSRTHTHTHIHNTVRVTQTESLSRVLLVRTHSESCHTWMRLGRTPASPGRRYTRLCSFSGGIDKYFRPTTIHHSGPIQRLKGWWSSRVPPRFLESRQKTAL